MCDSDDGAIGKGGAKDMLDEGVSFGVEAASTLTQTVRRKNDGCLECAPARSLVENNNLSIHQNGSSEAE